MVFFILDLWMFLSAMEKPMRMLENCPPPPPAAETVVAEPQAVEEEGRCAALLE